MSLEEKLSLGLATSQIVLDQNKQQALIQYLHLINKWNKVHNLTAIRDEESMLLLHILDSLVVLPFVQAGESLIDVGSGAGLPGIVLAICMPDLDVTVIDASQKKASFMRQAKAELGLSNLKVLSGRVEQLNDATSFDVIISRAFSSLVTFVSLTRNLIKPTGRWLAMKGQIPNDELLELKETMNMQVSKVEKLIVPGLDAERHLLIFNNSTDAFQI